MYNLLSHTRSVQLTLLVPFCRFGIKVNILLHMLTGSLDGYIFLQICIE